MGRFSLNGIFFEESLSHTLVHLEETLVDGVLVEVRRIVGEHRHHSVRERTIERIVAGEYRHAFGFEFRLHLIERVAHLVAQRLRLFRACDDAPIVVAQHNHGLTYQVGAKHSFARTVEVVAICQSYHSTNLFYNQFNNLSYQRRYYLLR